ncbi:MAG: hypothetical protein A2381_17590 [Bdellovibrionales bacterium RIFOXYB1_FULL_37_110]|nr:MAG: hypothetical protein A2181_00715 [Bdellovibrionales bacterium RIFOXYA1_FULL_38_20]OFZ48004.1 MAG: hypothetical protein A2417_15565 [Bdellovibrionales bacterium RIFOXYC1_FULL_37_79]OFZ58021.1 MAG: hypothetical protein A2381_17590 [Bdellovibrionales bacterium RIFOXYB1_FULL_37_110]OFZ61685.1 MAG: hypothetical protein A2577_18195 [Bdellovibrionales bacterium RIFOXYD1_FULL_36_51]
MKNTYVITGGTRGIGGGISLKLLSQGHKVFALYARNTQEANKLIELAKNLRGELVCLRGDLTISENMAQIGQQILDSADSINGLIHCAASGVHRSVDQLKTKHLRWTFEVNFFSFHELFLILLPKLTKGSKIIGLTSAGSQRYLQQYAAVASSKGALDALLRHYAVELAPREISVNLVCPGMVETEAINSFPNREERINAAKALTPSGRLTTVEDVANLILYILLVEHNQFTGQTFYLDGGKSLLA